MQVNLLNPQTQFKHKARKEETRKPLYWLGGVLGIVLATYLGLVFATFQADNQKAILETEISEKQAAANALEVEAKFQRDVDDKAKLIPRLESEKRIISPLLKKIATLMPASVNITTWELNVENQWLITGSCKDFGSLAQFVSALQSAEAFESVVVLAVNRDENQGITYNLRIKLPQGGKLNE